MSIQTFVAAAAAVSLVLALGSAEAGKLDYPPNGEHVQQIAANDTANGNVWTGVAQSFVAPNARNGMGFYMWDFTDQGGRFRYTLYAGDGVFDHELSHHIVKMPANHQYVQTVVMADFSDVKLVIGRLYTLVASRADYRLPPEGTMEHISIMYAGTTDGLAYPDGKFWYTGASYPPEWFWDRDIAFRVIPCKGRQGQVC